MKYRHLRIAFSAMCGLLCLLLIALWVRSYSRQDRIFGHTSASGVLEIQSIHGQLVWIHGVERNANAGLGNGWYIESHRIQAPRLLQFLLPGFMVTRYPNVVDIATPYWFLLLVTLSLGIELWLRWRFSLRTLLIAASVVAVGLGVLVWPAD